MCRGYRAVVATLAGLWSSDAVSVSHHPSAEAAALAMATAELQEQRALMRREIEPAVSLTETDSESDPTAEIVDRVIAGNVSGSNQEGSEAGQTKQFWLEAGCRSLTTDPAMAGKFAAMTESVGKIQCCHDDAPTGSACVRKVSGVCMSGNNTESLVSFKQAALVCETNGYRLCTKQELQEDSSLGCCKQGCGIDTMLVWTSTFSYKNLKESNEELKTEIDNIETENAHIEREHKELAYRMGELQNGFNKSSIPPGFKPPPPPDTVNQASIPTITGDEAEYLAKENSRLWYEVQAMRRENDELKDHIVAIVNGTIVVGGKGMDMRTGDARGPLHYPDHGPGQMGPGGPGGPGFDFEGDGAGAGGAFPPPPPPEGFDGQPGSGSPGNFARPFGGPGPGPDTNTSHGPPHKSDEWQARQDGKVWKTNAGPGNRTVVHDVPRARDYDQIMMTTGRQHQASVQNRSNLSSNISSAQSGDITVGPTYVHNSRAMGHSSTAALAAAAAAAVALWGSLL